MSDVVVHDVTAHRLLTLLAREQAEARVPSLAAGVVREGTIVWSGVRGTADPFADAGDASPDDALDTQYRIGSITKTMTAALVLQLRDEGRLRLTDSLERHLPGVAYGDRTLRELLSHSSGIPAEPPGPWWERSPGVSYAELTGQLDTTNRPFPPGTAYHYSNLAYALLGRVVEQLRGESWMSVLTSRLLLPLGMTRTTYAAVPPSAPGFSVGAFDGLLTPEPSHDSLAMAPAGQLWSTIADLATWAAFLIDPAPSVLAADSVAEMTVGQIGLPDDVAAGSYGLGLRLATAGGRSYVGHTGSVPGFLAGLFVDRGRQSGAVCLANGANGVRAQGLPLDLLSTLEELEPALPATWTPTQALAPGVRELLGLWYWGNMAFTLSYQAPRLEARILDEGDPWCTFDVTPDGGLVGATGYFAGEPVSVVRRPDGTVGHVECATFILTRVPYDPEAPIPGGAPRV